MNSLESLKQELITQKNLLQERGFNVSTQYENPAPKEITQAISNINIDFSQVTATPDDVALDKKFHASDGTLQTGTVDIASAKKYSALGLSILTGQDPSPIIFPPAPYNTVRPYAYYSNTLGDYSANPLEIPAHISTLGEFSFAYSNIGGPLVIPQTCTKVGNSAFRNTQITEITAYNGLSDASTYTFAYCTNLTKFTSYCNSIGTCVMGYNTALTEVYLYNLKYIDTYAFRNCSALKYVWVNATEAPKFETNMFSNCSTPTLLINAEFYGSTASQNVTKYCTLLGYKSCTAGETFATLSDGDIPIAWYATINDAKAKTNPITTCPADGQYYCRRSDQ